MNLISRAYGNGSATLLAVSMLALGASTGAAAGEAALDDGFHRDFDAVLTEHVDAGQVDYPGIAADRRFHDYVAALEEASVPESAPLEQRLAFWVNAYNALAIEGILAGGSPSSLFGRLSYFKRDEYRVAGRTITLYDLERDVIIPLGDNRIHFAIVCASASCPPLRAEAYVPSRIDAQLQEQSEIFVNDDSKNAFDLQRGRARVSKIFDWFEDDFVAESGSVQRYLARFVRDPDVRDALTNDRLRVRHKKYDWSLNGTPPPET